MPGNRVSLRLPDYNYRFGGFFFTLVTENRLPLFGQIMNGKVHLSPEGQIVEQEWLRTPQIRREIQLDEWTIMPDHFPAIVFMHGTISNGHVGGAGWRPCPSEREGIKDNTERIRSVQPAQRSLARMINQFKATTTRRINEMRSTSGQPIWQRGYHDRIIRNVVELDKLRDYIRDNPKQWA